MNHDITMTAASLATFLDRIGLPPVAPDRVAEIDRILASELAGDEPDAEGCASLVLEAADLIVDRDPVGFDWRGWEDDPGEATDFDLDGIEWGEA